MIQFETVKYGILKPKDNQRNIKGDNTSGCSEEDVLLADTNSLLTVEPCHDSAFDDEQTVSSPKEVLCKKNEDSLKMNCTGDMDTDESYHESEGEGDEMERLNLNDGKISKHNEDAANNNGNHDGEENGDEEPEKSEQTEQLADGSFGAPGYFSLEALQKMAQFVSAAIANNSDNEDAQKQLAVLQTTLFTLQHQQLFQLQLIQQLQSQLSINRSDKDDEDVDEEDEREEGELTQEQMDEEQRKYEEEQRQIRKEEEESLKAKKEAMSDKEKEGFQPLNPNLPIGPNDTISAMEASFSSSFASTIITNHDQPSSMDGLNSLEMLQKRAEEVLDSASRGILSGSLADEMSFKNDGKGRNEPFFKHRCRFCGKVFGSDSALQIHIRSHTGERPFKCNVCGSRFTTKGNLKVHFQRHTQKFPHINMNPHPIPEHLDKFYPPLLPPLPPGQQPPISPPPPQSSRPPAPMNLPFPPIPGLPPGLQGFQGIPGLPLFRPPFDLLKQMGAHPFFGAIRDAVHQEQRQDVEKQHTEEQVSPADLSKPPLITSPKIKDEPKEESVSPQPSEETQNEPKLNEEVVDKPKSSESPPSPMWKERDLRKDCISPAKSIEGYSSPKEQPENLSKISAKLSPSSIGSSRDNHIMDNQNEIKIFPSMMPRPGSTDNSWESYIEVDKSSETSKLQQLVDNIENKITDPNECCVCHKVLSCRSALQMHYRTHTGERPFRCKICGRAFTTKGNLKTHMSVHRMKPPMRTIHQCPVCHKKYSNSLVLQQHIRLHTGEPTDLTAEQIQAAEIRDFPSMSPGSFPMGLNPFAFPIPGMHPGSIGPESSIGENDDFMDEDFDDASNFDENMSNAGSVSGDSTQNISNYSRANNDDNNHHSRAISAMLAEHSKTTENLSRAPSSASRAESVDDKSLSPRTPPQSSPAPSDISQGALDLTPRSEPKHSPPMIPQPHPAGGIAGFPNFPFMPHVATTSAPSSMMNNAFNSLAQSVSPMGPFNPIALAGMRGNTTCKICLKTFACQSALEIHYRSHTKERPYKCTICDKAFTTKNEELIHTSLHFQIYGNMKQHMMTHKLRDMPPHMFGSTPQPIPQSESPIRSPEHKDTPQIRIKSEAELSPRSSENSRGTTTSSNNERSSSSKRERSLPPQFQIQPESNYQMMMDRQQAKAEARLKRSQVENEQPIAKRPLVTESHVQEPISMNNKKEAFHMPPHPEEKTSSHLERLQQFHTSSLLNQPLKMDAHLKATTSPGSDIGSGSGDQKHYCHLCQKNFSSTSSLQIHMRTHTGERPFVCNVCQKAFTTKGNLKVHMGIHTWSGASRRGRRMSLELPFNGSMPLMLQNPDFLQRHSDFFHPYPPTHLLGRMQQSMNMEQQKFERGAPQPPPILNLAHKYMNANGLGGLAGHPMSNHIDNRQPPYNSSPSPSSDKHTASPNSLRDDMLMDSPKRNGDLSPARTVTPDLSPRLWKLHYESKAVNRDNIDAKSDDQAKSVEELIA